MSDEDQKKDVHLGMFDRPQGRRVYAGDWAAGALSVIWIIICVMVYYFAGQPDAGFSFSALNFVVTVLAVLLPIALIWVAAVAARSVTVVREESIRMQAAVDTLRKNFVDLSQSSRMQVKPAEPAIPVAPQPVEPAQPPNVELSTDAAPDQNQAPEPAATFKSARRPGPKPGEQPDLALGIPGPNALPELTSEDFIRALNFPRTADDRAGFRSLRRAMANPKTGKLIQAAQDVLTLLSQEGIYTDDLTPDRAHPDVWRKFADGTRGRPIATIGGIRDRESLTKTATRMRSDHIFRDTAHHFLRLFDKTFAAFAPEATDAEIAALAETRSARAFMLVGRVAGTFD